MELIIQLKGNSTPLKFIGDRIEVLDYEMDNIKYKQVRYFRKGFSKSQYINTELIRKISLKD